MSSFRSWKTTTLEVVSVQSSTKASSADLIGGSKLPRYVDEQIVPIWILFLNQINLPIPLVALQPFLSPDRKLNILEDLKIYQPIDAITFREAGH